MCKEIVYTYDILPDYVKAWADACVATRLARTFKWRKYIVEDYEEDGVTTVVPFKVKKHILFTCYAGSTYVGKVLLNVFETANHTELDLGLSVNVNNYNFICQYSKSGTYILEQIHLCKPSDKLSKNYLYITSKPELYLSIVNAQAADALSRFREETQSEYNFEEED